jgi:hypothetical protein
MTKTTSVYQEDVDRLILEVMMVQLKKSSDWWLGSGIFLLLWACLGFPFIFWFSIPLAVMGILIMIYGMELRRKWFNLAYRTQPVVYQYALAKHAKKKGMKSKKKGGAEKSSISIPEKVEENPTNENVEKLPERDSEENQEP